MSSDTLPLNAPVVGMAMIPGYNMSWDAYEGDAYEGYIKHQFVDQAPSNKERGWSNFRGSRCDLPQGERGEMLIVGWESDGVPPAVRQGLLSAVHFVLLKDLENSNK
jgi:hypothetical protein